MQGAEKEIVEAAASGSLDELNLPSDQKQLLEFVRLLTVSPSKNSPNEIAKLRQAGWNDEQISEAVLVVGMFSMFNRVADAFGLQDPNYFEKEKKGEAIVPATRSS